MDWKKLVSDLGVKVLYSNEITASANYFPLANAIILNSNLVEEELERVALHEVGHSIIHQNQSAMYHATQISNLVMEYEAEAFVLGILLPAYLEVTEKEEVSSVRFIEGFGLNPTFEPLVRKMILGYFYDKNS